MSTRSDELSDANLYIVDLSSVQTDTEQRASLQVLTSGKQCLPVICHHQVAVSSTERSIYLSLTLASANVYDRSWHTST